MSRAISRLAGILSAACVAGAAGPAAAIDLWGGTLTPSVGAQSDYVFRGRSQNDEDLSVNARLDYSHASGAFAGAEGHTVDFGGGEDAHLRLYGGHTGDIGSMFYVLSGEYNAYPDSGLNLGYPEFRGTVGVDYGVAILRSGAAYSPDFFADSGNSLYVFSNFDVYLPLGWPVTVSVNGEIGYQTIQDHRAFGAGDHATWNLGLTVTYKRFDFDVTYHDATIGAARFGQDSDARLTGGVTVYF